MKKKKKINAILAPIWRSFKLSAGNGGKGSPRNTDKTRRGRNSYYDDNMKIYSYLQTRLEIIYYLSYILLFFKPFKLIISYYNNYYNYYNNKYLWLFFFFFTFEFLISKYRNNIIWFLWVSIKRYLHRKYC